MPFFFHGQLSKFERTKKIAEFSFLSEPSITFVIISILILYQFIDSSIVPFYAYLTSLVIVSLLSFIIQILVKEKI